MMIINKEEICKTRLVHGFHSRKVMVDLNESLETIPQVFATGC